LARRERERERKRERERLPCHFYLISQSKWQVESRDRRKHNFTIAPFPFSLSSIGDVICDYMNHNSTIISLYAFSSFLSSLFSLQDIESMNWALQWPLSPLSASSIHIVFWFLGHWPKTMKNPRIRE
jgi:hypothetical protein